MNYLYVTPNRLIQRNLKHCIEFKFHNIKGVAAMINSQFTIITYCFYLQFFEMKYQLFHRIWRSVGKVVYVQFNSNIIYVTLSRRRTF